jgi:TPR repeat protein
MTLARLFALLLFADANYVALANAAYAEGGADVYRGRPVNGNAAFVIPQQDIPAFAHRALMGSGEAAIRLGNYYYFVKLDQSEGRYWMTIAAENGLPNAMYNLGFYLRLSKDERDRTRARYWLGRAEELGSKSTAEQAQALLSEMDKSLGDK